MDLYEVENGLRANDHDEKVVKMLREVLPAERIGFKEFSEIRKRLTDGER
ncbi:MAG: hypothetical protein ACE5IJ_00320 [Thermoplasmata archaeon]